MEALEEDEWEGEGHPASTLLLELAPHVAGRLLSLDLLGTWRPSCHFPCTRRAADGSARRGRRRRPPPPAPAPHRTLPPSAPPATALRSELAPCSALRELALSAACIDASQLPPHLTGLTVVGISERMRSGPLFQGAHGGWRRRVTPVQLRRLALLFRAVKPLPRAEALAHLQNLAGGDMRDLEELELALPRPELLHALSFLTGALSFPRLARLSLHAQSAAKRPAPAVGGAALRQRLGECSLPLLRAGVLAAALRVLPALRSARLQAGNVYALADAAELSALTQLTLLVRCLAAGAPLADCLIVDRARSCRSPPPQTRPSSRLTRAPPSLGAGAGPPGGAGGRVGCASGGDGPRPHAGAPADGLGRRRALGAAVTCLPSDCGDADALCVLVVNTR